MKNCSYCNKPIEIMSPFQCKDEFLDEVTMFFCSNLCMKTYKYEITEEERKVLVDAAVEKSPTTK